MIGRLLLLAGIFIFPVTLPLLFRSAVVLRVVCIAWICMWGLAVCFFASHRAGHNAVIRQIEQHQNASDDYRQGAFQTANLAQTGSIWITLPIVLGLTVLALIPTKPKK